MAFIDTADETLMAGKSTGYDTCIFLSGDMGIETICVL